MPLDFRRLDQIKRWLNRAGTETRTQTEIVRSAILHFHVAIQDEAREERRKKNGHDKG